MVKCIVLNTKGEATEKNIDMSNRELNDIIGGYFELVPFKINDKVYDIFCHSEGKILNLPITCFIQYENGVDSICGDIVISKADKMGEQIDLEGSEIRDILHYIQWCKQTGHSIVFYWLKNGF